MVEEPFGKVISGMLIAISWISAIAWESVAQANPGNAYGLDAMSTARAMTVTATAPATSAVSTNPALLIQMDPDSIEAAIDILVSDDGFKINRKSARLDPYVGYRLEAALTLPLGPFRDRVFLGASLHLPHQHLYTQNPPAVEEPFILNYGSDTRNLSIDAGLAVRIWNRLGIGIAFHAVPKVNGTVNVSFANHKEASTTDIRVDSQFVPIIGIYAEIIDHLQLGLTYRKATRMPMDITADIFISESIGTIHTRLKSYSHTEPHAVMLGVGYDFSHLATHPLLRFKTSLDLEWDHYVHPIALSSQVWLYDDSGVNVNNGPEAEYDHYQEGFSLRTALDWMPTEDLTASVGYAFWKTPVPAQRGVFNVLDSSHHDLSFGISYWLPQEWLGSFDIGFATSARFAFFQPREMEKYEFLPQNPGFPSIRFEGFDFAWHGTIMMKFR